MRDKDCEEPEEPVERILKGAEGHRGIRLVHVLEIELTEDGWVEAGGSAFVVAKRVVVLYMVDDPEGDKI